MSTEQADENWDNYQERVTRNEGRLQGLENLVAETRTADTKLIDQRSESLAQELERAAKALEQLMVGQRNADNAEHRAALAAHVKTADTSLGLLREVYDTAVSKNDEQSSEAIKGLEERRKAATDKLEDLVRGWRESDTKALDKQALEYSRRLDVLNHAHERQEDFQINAVTRELFGSEKEAQLNREDVLRQQIIALDRTMLGMTPITTSDKAHVELGQRHRDEVAAATLTLNTKINVLDDKVEELKSSKDMLAGKSQGTTVTIGYLIAAATLVISVVVLFANRLAG